MNGAAFQRAVTVAFAPGTLWADIAPKVAAYARADRDAKITAGQFPPAFTTRVNGVVGAAEESLKPGGVIFYEGLMLGPAVDFAIHFLRHRMPVRRGAYADSLLVGVSRGSADGSPIPWRRFDPTKVSPDATTAFIFSPLPFSRLLDVQLDGTRPIKVRAAAGFFDDTADAVRRAFPTVRAERLYTVRHPWAARRKGDGKRIEYPAVRISVGRG